MDALTRRTKAPAGGFLELRKSEGATAWREITARRRYPSTVFLTLGTGNQAIVPDSALSCLGDLREPHVEEHPHVVEFLLRDAVGQSLVHASAEIDVVGEPLDGVGDTGRGNHVVA